MPLRKALQLYNPLCYYVNNVSELRADVVKAQTGNDAGKIRQLLADSPKTSFDVFICVNSHWHAFVLCVPCEESQLFGNMFKDDPYSIPEDLLCWRYELCFENEALMTYKIAKTFAEGKTLHKSAKSSFYIGRYKDMPNPVALELSALRSAPHHYQHIINDCVEFSKEFCICLLSYCSNGRALEAQVEEQIKNASATGLSVEVLSRKSKLSGLLGNFSLSSLDISSFVATRQGLLCLVIGILLLLLYPLVIAILVCKWMK